MNIRCRCGLGEESDISGMSMNAEVKAGADFHAWFSPLICYRIRIKPDKKFVLGEEKSDECVSLFVCLFVCFLRNSGCNIAV